jgi:hypothetical protein
MAEQKSVIEQYEQPKNPVKKGATQLEADVHKMSRDVRALTIITLVATSLSIVSFIISIISAANLGAIASNTDSKKNSSLSR